MKIVAGEETRNARWANDTNAFGRRMLEKMGWKGDGAGLGREQQGTSTHLRAVRRADGLGIGAANDSFGERGWQDTNAGFHGVLAGLKAEYGSDGGGGGDVDGATERKRRRKEERRRKRREERRRAKKGNSIGGGDGSDDDDGAVAGVRLPQNRVRAGHARKMQEAKDLRSKSAADMAAIFGVKADFYQRPRDWVGGGDGGGGCDDDGEEKGKGEDGNDSSAASSSDAGAKKKKKMSKKKKKSKDDAGKTKRDKKRRTRDGRDSSEGEGKKRKKSKSDKK